MKRDIFGAIPDEDMEKKLSLLRDLKNQVIGSNRQKEQLVENDMIKRLLEIAIDQEIRIDIRREAILVLTSVAKGGDKFLAEVASDNTIPIFLTLVDSELFESSLRLLRLVFCSPSALSSFLYSDHSYIQILIRNLPMSSCSRLCVTDILARTCTCESRQKLLLDEGIIDAVTPIIFGESSKELVPALLCASAVIYENQYGAHVLSQVKKNGVTVADRCSQLREGRGNCELELAASRLVIFLWRADRIKSLSVSIDATVSTLVRIGCCVDDSSMRRMQMRVEAIDTLAYAIERDVRLQRLVADNCQCLKQMLRAIPDAATHRLLSAHLSPEDQEWMGELETSALGVVASLISNEEEMRRRLQTDNLYLLASIERCKDKKRAEKHLKALARCLHSLSRSVEQLRTAFHDPAVSALLLEMTESSNDQLVAIASAVLCNLSLEFCPCKQKLVDSGLIDILGSLARRSSPSLRLNGLWGLMNLAYRADESVKRRIMQSLSADQLLRLLTESTDDTAIVIKTLALLRNILSQPAEGRHIDEIMSVHGSSIIQAVVYVLETKFSSEAKAVALCILSNIAAGGLAKKFIYCNEDLLGKIANYLISGNVALQLAATFCIYNLICREDIGYEDRQAKLREFGIDRLLLQMPNINTDGNLNERMQLTKRQFSPNYE